MLAQGVWLRGYYDTLSVVARCIRAIDIRHIIILVTDLEYFEKAIVDRVALFLYELIYKKIKTAVEMSEADDDKTKHRRRARQAQTQQL